MSQVERHEEMRGSRHLTNSERTPKTQLNRERTEKKEQIQAELQELIEQAASAEQLQYVLAFARMTLMRSSGRTE